MSLVGNGTQKSAECANCVRSFVKVRQLSPSFRLRDLAIRVVDVSMMSSSVSFVVSESAGPLKTAVMRAKVAPLSKSGQLVSVTFVGLLLEFAT